MSERGHDERTRAGGRAGEGENEGENRNRAMKGTDGSGVGPCQGRGRASIAGLARCPTGSRAAAAGVLRVLKGTLRGSVVVIKGNLGYTTGYTTGSHPAELCGVQAQNKQTTPFPRPGGGRRARQRSAPAGTSTRALDGRRPSPRRSPRRSRRCSRAVALRHHALAALALACAGGARMRGRGRPPAQLAPS
jgi:hypothetical protein